MKKNNNKRDAQKSLDFIIDHMAMKADIAELPTKDDVRNIVHEELKDIRKQLEVLEESSKSHAGFSKEIDHVLQRVIAIEKHLGIKTKALV